MNCRVGTGARTQIAQILIKSTFDHGDRHADNYRLLLETAMDDIAAYPDRLGARSLPGFSGVWGYDIRLSKNRVARNSRIRNAWRKLIYTRGPGGIVEVLAVVGRSYPSGRAAREGIAAR
ncbi:MAG TPA: hypothetical protein VND19_25260 [Acetobacteraceae bacterium]|nr:hypothetical protein [Acetobacteraceae bacterium]